MKRILLLILATNLVACNPFETTSGSSSSTNASATDEVAANSGDYGDLQAEGQDNEDQSGLEEGNQDQNGDEQNSDDQNNEEQDSEEQNEETDEVVVDDQQDEEQNTCEYVAFEEGKLEICDQRVIYYFVDSQQVEHQTLLSEFQILPEKLHLVTSYYRDVQGGFYVFPTDNSFEQPVSVILPREIYATGAPGENHQLIIHANQDIVCIYKSQQNQYYGKPVCYEGGMILDNGDVQVAGGKRISTDALREITYLRAFIRGADGRGVLTRVDIDLYYMR